MKNSILSWLVIVLLPIQIFSQRKLLLLDEGRKNLVLVNENSSTPIWSKNLGTSRGLQLMGKNRVLVSTDKGFREVDLETGNTLLRVEKWQDVQDARRLPNGNVMLGANISGKITLIEVNHNNEESRRFSLNVTISSGMRQMRIGADGNFYIAADDKVHVINSAGTLVRSLDVPAGNGVYKAVRMEDGNVWVSTGYGGSLVQMNATGSVLKVWAIPDQYKSPVSSDPNFASDFQILENGHIILTVWHGHSDAVGGHGKALIEYNPQGEVVWTWDGASVTSSLHGAIIMDGLDTEILNDERNGPIESLPYSYPPIGTGIENRAWSTGELFKEVSEIIVPPAPPDTTTQYPNGNNYVSMYKGYLFIPFASDHMLNQGGFQFWDVSDLEDPKVVATHNDRTTGTSVEAHGYGFATLNGRDYACFQDQYGIVIWDFTDIQNLKLVSKLSLPGIGSGGYDNGVFGVFWQHPYVYAAGSAHGVFVIDVHDLENPTMVKQIPSNTMGSFRVGNTFAIGNLLLASTVRGGNNKGLAFFDISNPADPVLLSVPTTAAPNGFYSALINGNQLYLGGDERVGTSGTPSTLHVYELFDFPNIVLSGTIPNNMGTGEYQFIQDDNVIYGMEELWVKSNLKNGNYRVLGTGSFSETTFHGQQEGHPTPLGNVIFLGDDHTRASSFFVHDVNRDEMPPRVNMVVPSNGALNQPLTSAIGVTFSDQIDVQSINKNTFVVRLQNGDPIEGYISTQQYIANFVPVSPLLPNQIYEIRINGVKDFVGNVMDAPFHSAFSTGGSAFTPPGDIVLKGNQLAVSAPSEAGFEASKANDIDFSTLWHSPFTGTALPVEIVLDLKIELNVHRLNYYPRKDNQPNGIITQYEVHISSNQSTWTKVAEGSWDSNLHTKYAEFEKVSGRYVKLVAIQGAGGFASASEFSVEAGTGLVVSLEKPSVDFRKKSYLTLSPFGKITYQDVGQLREIELVDLRGKKIASWTPANLPIDNVVSQRGLYVLRLHGEKGRTVNKVIF